MVSFTFLVKTGVSYLPVFDLHSGANATTMFPYTPEHTFLDWIGR